MEKKLKVLLTTEGTYPFHQGGVSTWCDILVKNLKEVDYVLYSIIMNPFVTQKFTLPESAKLIKLPLWGTEEPSEHLETPFSQVYLSKRKTVDKVVEEGFIPLFSDLVDEIIGLKKDHQRLGETLLNLYTYFKEFEYKKSFKSELAWEVYKETVTKNVKDKKNKLDEPNIYSMIQSLGWIYRFLNILNTPVPKVNVSHSAAAAFCGIPCVIAKLQDNTPFLLTEHGVYLREQYLSLAQRKYPSFLSTFLIRMVHSVSELNFYFADQVSPVCAYNTRWERKFGVKKERLQVIYNGVDQKIFFPEEAVEKKAGKTVVALARIDPIKDIETLLRAAALVREEFTDVRFIIYGSVSVPDYYEKCLELRKELKLEDIFTFAGHTTDTPGAYKAGDIIALSSISEAFPYSVVEAMMTGKPVVATDVGGIKEALGETGFIVPPRHPREFADAVISLLKNPSLCEQLGEDARQRALNYFTIGKMLGMHLKSYINLAAGIHNLATGTRQVQRRNIRGRKQGLLLERGEALLKLGFYEEAVGQLKLAVKEAPDSTAVPVILTKIADAYNHLGQYDKLFDTLEKAEVLEKLRENKVIA